MERSVQNVPLQVIHSDLEERFHVLRPMLYQEFENIAQGGEEGVLAVMKASSTCVNPPWRFFLRESPNASSREKLRSSRFRKLNDRNRKKFNSSNLYNYNALKLNGIAPKSSYEPCTY